MPFRADLEIRKNEWTNTVFNYICLKNSKINVNSAMGIYVCSASWVANLDIGIVVIHGSKFVTKKYRLKKLAWSGWRSCLYYGLDQRHALWGLPLFRSKWTARIRKIVIRNVELEECKIVWQNIKVSLQRPIQHNQSKYLTVNLEILS